MDHIANLLLGLGAGAVIAALALGIVLAYRASGVVNFAHASMGMFLAYVFFELRSSGDLVMPLPWDWAHLRLFTAGVEGRSALICCGIPTRPVAITITLVYATLLGLVTYVLVFRPLRSAPPLAKVVASVGLFLYLFAIADLQFGGQGAATSSPTHILPTGGVDVLGRVIPQNRFWLALLVVVTAGVLAAVYRYTRFGLATRAAAEDEKAAVLLGLSPDALAALNWMIAGFLAGAAVMLFAPIAGLNPAGTSLLIVPAVAAALVGRFTSFGLTLAAGLGIGMLQSWILSVQTDHSWLPAGTQVAVPLLLIVAVMALRGESLPSRGAIREDRYPLSPVPRHAVLAALVLTALALVALFTLDSTWRQGIILSSIFALLSLSVVVLTGYLGQISLAPIAFAGVAAFSMVKITDWGVPFPFAPVLGALVATGLGVLLGLPALRVRGMNLAIATLAAAVAIEELLLKWEWFSGGALGRDVPVPTFFGVDLGISAQGADFPRAAYGAVCVVTLALCALGVAHLRRGTLGLRLLAIRSNERAAAASGIDIRRTKLIAFAVSSFLAGLGGCLLAYQRQTLSASSFAVFESLALLALTYLAGIAGIGGALLAGVFARGGILTAALGGSASEYQFAINGVALMVVAVLYPNGITGALYRLSALVSRRGDGSPPGDPGIGDALSDEVHAAATVAGDG